MVDLTEQEQAAMRAAMRRVAETMARSAGATRFQDLTRRRC